MPSAAPYLFPAGSQIGQDKVVLHASARRHKVDAYSGPSSIKTVVRGSVSWVVSGRHLVVDPSSFLVLSQGQRYSMNIDALQPVETCCVFFAPAFLERTALDLTFGVDASLDAPQPTAPLMPYLFALHSDRARKLMRRVASLASSCENTLRPSGTEESFLLLAISLLGYYEAIRAQALRVPAVRSSTRQEVYRRLLIGRDYMHSHASDALSLAAIARAACLSPFHFHRGFVHAFQETPHGYLTGLRMAQARILIEAGASVLTACTAVGFSSPSAFCRTFRKHIGCPPSALRRKIARSGKHVAANSEIVVA